MVSESGGRNIAGLVQRSNTPAPAWEYFGYSSNDKGEPANMINLCALFASRKLWLKRGNTSNLPTRNKLRSSGTQARIIKRRVVISFIFIILLTLSINLSRAAGQL